MQFVLSAACHRAGIRVRVLASVAVLLLSVVSVSGRSRQTGTIAGRIVDSGTGNGIPAAVVSIEDVERTVTSDHGGRFEADSVPDGRLEMYVEATGYTAVSRRVHVTEDDTVWVDIALDPLSRAGAPGCDTCQLGAIIVGRVLDTLGSPIKGATVVLGDGDAMETTGSDGTFSFPALPEGTYRVTVTRDELRGDTLRDLVVADGRAVIVASVLRPSRGIDEVTGVALGVVRSGGDSAAVGGATVSLLNTDYTCLTDSSGAFELRAIPPGAYSLLATKWGFEAQVLSGVEIEAGAVTRRDVMLAPRAAGAFPDDGAVGGIAGIVSDESGEAVANALMFLRDQDRSVHSDYMGRYTFDSLTSGVYSVAAVADGYDTSSTHDVDVWSGEMTTLNLMLRKQVEISADSLVPGPNRGLFTGLVVDAEKGQPIPGAEVLVHGERGLKSVTDLNGRYVIRAVMPGTYALEVSHAKYTTQVTSGVKAVAGRKTVADFVLSTSDVSRMARMSIRAVAIKNTGAALLKERQRAINLTDAIGSQEMSRAGASTAADAMKTVTGVTIVDGKYVIIRGLPAAYTTVMLNGAPLPYPDPDVKAFPMDLFPSGVLENITVYKTFTPNLPPYWAGGVVDVRTKPFPDQLTLSASASHSYNTQSTFSDDYLTYEGGSLDWLGFDDGTRALPDVYEDYTKTEIDGYYGIPAVPFNEQRTANRLNDPSDTLYGSLLLLDEMATSLDSTMVPHKERAGADQGYSFSVGNTLTLFDRPLGFRAGLTYSNSYALSLEDRRTSFSFNQFDHTLPEGGQKVDLQNDFAMTNSANKVLWSLLANGAYELADNHKLKLDYLYVRKAEDKVRRVYGYYSYYDNAGDFDTRRLHYVERSLNYVQSIGSHRLYFGAMPLQIDWRGSFTASSQDEPDMRNSYHFTSTDTAGNTIYTYVPNVDQPSHQWRELDEKAGAGQLEIALPFYQWNGDSATAKVGGGWVGRWRERSQRYLEYQLDQYLSDLAFYAPEIDPRQLSSQDLMSPEHVGLLPDSIDDPSTIPPTEATLTGYRPGMFVRDQSNDHAQWGGTEQTISAFGMVELPLFGPVAVTGGLRFEYGYLHGETTVENSRLKDSTVADRRDVDWLPALAVNTKLRDDMNVRLAYGRTLITPSMRELAPYNTSSFTGGPSFTGYRHLQTSDVDNVDARWEWFLRPGELVAASAFYKLIHNPIETRFFENDIRVPQNTSSDAHILGLELEARKRLDMVHWLRHFQLSGNLTLAYSRVYLDPDMRKLESYFPDEATDHRPYQGQSPFVVNVFFTYDNPDIGTNVSLYYNVFGERLAELTDVDQPWLWERPQHLLNLTWKQKVSERWTLEGKAKNLLFSTRKFVHHYDGRELVVEETKPGATFSLKASVRL